MLLQTRKILELHEQEDQKFHHSIVNDEVKEAVEKVVRLGYPRSSAMSIARYLTLRDVVHPNEIGSDIFAQCIIDEMKQKSTVFSDISSLSYELQNAEAKASESRNFYLESDYPIDIKEPIRQGAGLGQCVPRQPRPIARPDACGSVHR